jgi:outer membrane lipoprotein LolB
MRNCLVVVLTTMLLSCSTLPVEEQQKLIAARWQAHLLSLQNLDSWRANGRIAVSTADDGGNAHLIWTQRPDGFVLRLSAAFGRGTLQISQESSGARLVAPSGRIFHGANADLLLYQYLGWYIPVEKLRYWMTGRPGSTDNYTLDSQGLLKSDQLDGWTVEFQEYGDDFYPVVPSRIRLHRDDINIRVVIDGWSHRKQIIKSQRILLPE